MVDDRHADDAKDPESLRCHLDPSTLRRGYVVDYTIIGSVAESRFQYVPSSTNQLERIEFLPWSRNTLGRVVKNIHYVIPAGLLHLRRTLITIELLSGP